MKLKAKLISTIAAACLVIALLVTGVWAVSTASVTLGGSISFSATNVHATIAGTIDGAVSSETIETLEYNSTTNESDPAFVSKLDTWSQDLVFDSNNLITMSITVTNLSTERSLFVKLTDNTDVTNLTDVVKNGEETYTSGTEVELVAGTEETKNSVTFNITLNATSTDESVDGNYAYKVDLRDESAEVPVEPTVLTYGDYENTNTGEMYTGWGANSLIYTLSTDGSNTASIIGCEDTVIDLVIPAKVKAEDTIYDVTSIEDNVFYVCRIESVEIPSSVSIIGSNAFSDCYKLNSVKIGEGLTTIEYFAFNDTGLISIEIPKSVTSIGNWAFNSCSCLTSVTFTRETPPTLGADVFDYCHEDLVIYVPADSLTTYQTEWASYNLDIQAIQ